MFEIRVVKNCIENNIKREHVVTFSGNDMENLTTLVVAYLRRGYFITNIGNVTTEDNTDNT